MNNIHITFIIIFMYLNTYCQGIPYNPPPSIVIYKSCNGVCNKNTYDNDNCLIYNDPCGNITNIYFNIPSYENNINLYSDSKCKNLINSTIIPCYDDDECPDINIFYLTNCVFDEILAIVIMSLTIIGIICVCIYCCCQYKCSSR